MLEEAFAAFSLNDGFRPATQSSPLFRTSHLDDKQSLIFVDPLLSA